MELGKGLDIELHSHNNFSNNRMPDSRFSDRDCGVSVGDQLRSAYEAGIDGFFLTNHNTLDGYKELLEHQKDNPKYGHIKIFQGAEYSINRFKKGDGIRHPHVGALGLSEQVAPYRSLDEILDDIKSQGALSVGNHPFDTTGSGLRERASKCDVVEVFNSNNYDMFSNLHAELFAMSEKKYGVVGSDSHLARTMGKSVITVYPRDMHRDDVKAEDVTDAIRLGNFSVKRASYNTLDDFKEVVLYHFLDNYKVIDGLAKKYTNLVGAAARTAVNVLHKHKSSRLVDFLGNAFVGRMRNVSMKVNMYGYDDSLLYEISAPAIFKKVAESIQKLDKSKSVLGKNFSEVGEYLAKYNFKCPEAEMNMRNDAVRGKALEILV